MGRAPRALELLCLRAIAAWDRLRLRGLARRHPGLRIHPSASSNLAVARFELDPAAQLWIGAGVSTERRAASLRFLIGAGAKVTIEEGSWLRTAVDRVVIAAGPGARIRIGPKSFLNGCQLSAKAGITVGAQTLVGFGSRLLDSDQHDLDDERRERSAPIVVGDHVWVAGDVTVLRGVHIGDHAVIGTRSLVTADVPPHTLAFGVPARAQGRVGDRSRTG